MNIKPIGKRVLIEACEAESRTVSGIIIPDTAKEKQQKGKVLAISAEVTKDENNVMKVGDTVLYGKYSGTEINVDGKNYLMINSEDILAII